MIPRIVHFVFGLEEQEEPFHFVHYLAIESARRMVRPEKIYLHYKHLPWGPWWDRVAPFVTPVAVDLVADVLGADYSSGLVPDAYRYAHHSDFVRLDALIEHGGVYADIDVVFVRPLPDELFRAPFVIGAEAPTRDELTGEFRPSLCNAVLMSEPGAPFARAWREEMPAALNGTWSNHSGFLAQSLSERMPGEVHVEPEQTFYPFSSDASGLARLFLQRHKLSDSTVSVHLWAHLWWERTRRDYSPAHAGWCTPSALRLARTTFAELARPYLPDNESGPRQDAHSSGGAPRAWIYLSQDDTSGYATAADRCIQALEESGQPVDWAPMVPLWGGPVTFAAPYLLDPFEGSATLEDAAADPLAEATRGWAREPGQVVVAHLVPEYLPLVRQRCGDAFLIGHTVWETDRIPEHWVSCFDPVDLLVVPSRFSAAAIEAVSSTTPVAVVPHVASVPRGSSRRDQEAIPPELYVFYSIGEWNERKAVFATVEAYLRAFSAADPVLLVLKTSPRDRRVVSSGSGGIVEDGSTARALAQMLARHPDHPEVMLVTRQVTDAEIESLHVRGDCFVSLCRSEGWGIGAFDAAVSGNPVVTTGFGGHLDYLAGSPYLVDYELVPVENPAGYPSYAPDQRWAEPNVDHGAELLRRVFSDRQAAAEAASLLAEEIRFRFRPEQVAATFRRAVYEHLGSRVV